MPFLEIVVDESNPANPSRAIADVGGKRFFGGWKSPWGAKADEFPAVWKNQARVLIGVVFIVWSFGIGVGFVYSMRYETTPTQTNAILNRWPADTECTLSASRPTLLMFVHPLCSCSRASVSELASLMSHCPRQLNTQVIFLKPSEFTDGWSKSDLWESVASIPGVVSRLDVDGIEHGRFKASVSGEVFLYQPSGDLVWHGGITAGRGHAGENRGRRTVEAFLHNNVLPVGSTPVFGCELESRKMSLSSYETCEDGRIIP